MIFLDRLFDDIKFFFDFLGYTFFGNIFTCIGGISLILGFFGLIATSVVDKYKKNELEAYNEEEKNEYYKKQYLLPVICFYTGILSEILGTILLIINGDKRGLQVVQYTVTGVIIYLIIRLFTKNKKTKKHSSIWEIYRPRYLTRWPKNEKPKDDL